MPLGLELVTAWVGTLPLTDIADEITRCGASGVTDVTRENGVSAQAYYAITQQRRPEGAAVVL
ncbi:MAG: hypothetical protein DYG89_46085 [Caldilinea sp. CFX5]|nr:hypothetical protein [Caldilinea sp. CFX5]